MNDGTAEVKTATMLEAYQNEPGNNGETVFTQHQVISPRTESASLKKNEAH